MKDTQYKIGDKVQLIMDYPGNAKKGETGIINEIINNPNLERECVRVLFKNKSRNIPCFTYRLKLISNEKPRNHPLTSIFL